MEELVITLREKEQYETYSAYIGYIKGEVEKQNSNVMKELMKKDSEISELKSQISSLEAQNANIEKNQTESSLSVTEKDLKQSVDELKNVLTGFTTIKEEFANYNTNSNQSEVVKQEEILDRLNDIEANMSIILTKTDDKQNVKSFEMTQDNDLIQSLNRLKEELAKFSEFKNIFENTNIEGNQYDVSKQEEILDRLKDIEADVAVVIEKTGIKQKFVTDDIAENKEENIAPINMEQAFSAISSQEIEPDKDFGPGKSLVEQASAFDNINNENQETIVPDTNVIDSIMPQTETAGETNDNNVTEEIHEETKKDNNEVRLEPSNIKVVRFGLDSLKEKNVTLKTALVKNAEMPVEFANYYNNAFNQQNVGRAR